MTSTRRPLLLVVDDETRVLSLIKRVGESEGFEVWCAPADAQALSWPRSGDRT